MLLNDLGLFVQVAQALSFTTAASELGIPASRVSRRISELEQRLGFKLFERTTRRVRLTAEGADLLARVDGPVEALQMVLGGAAADERAVAGGIRITAPPLAARTTIGARLLRFMGRHPDVSVELVSTAQALDFVRDGIDLAFRLSPLPSSDLIARRLWPVPYTLCASKAFIDRHDLGQAVSPARLAELPVVFTGQIWRFDELERHTPPMIRHHIDDLDLAAAAVAQGEGIAVLPSQLADEQGLLHLSVPGRTPTLRHMTAVYPSKRLLPARVRALIDWMAET